MSELVRVERDGGIATIRLDRPPMNALNAEIQGALSQACEIGRASCRERVSQTV